MRNFNFPYFSRDIAEFWRRWHISLTTWFRDYIYIPLGGSRGGKWLSMRNTMVIFLVSGFWHGANWTFVAWGVYHAFLFVPLLLLGANRKYIDSVVAEHRILPTLKELLQMGATFILALIGWIIFRSENIAQALEYIGRLFDKSLFSTPIWGDKMVYLFILLLLVVEWVGRRNQFALEHMPSNRLLRWGIYYALVGAIFLFAAQQASFIYFQF